MSRERDSWNIVISISRTIKNEFLIQKINRINDRRWHTPSVRMIINCKQGSEKQHQVIKFINGLFGSYIDQQW